MTSQISDEFESEVYPEGYSEALANCTVLAAKLIKKALVATEKEAP